jgi:2-dehydropantoate 2-reductase
MKYAVIGLGAVGSIVGCILKKSGENVVFVGKPKQVDIINKNGIKINSLNGSIYIKDPKAVSDFSILEDVDFIIVCVKSYDTRNLANQIKPYIKKSAIILSLQNGVKNSSILNEVTGNKTLSGIVLFNALYVSPGEATLTIKGGLLIEDEKSCSEAIRNLINSFNMKDLKSITVENIKGYQWSKLIVNLQNAVTTLTGQTIKESIIDTNTRSILIATMKEGINVLEKAGVSINALPDMDPKKMISRLSFYNSIILRIGSKFLRLKNARTSMWQSISRGKTTEIDFINGEIVNLAKKNKIRAPINEKLVKLVKQAEKKKLSKSFEPFELKEILKI